MAVSKIETRNLNTRLVVCKNSLIMFIKQDQAYELENIIVNNSQCTLYIKRRSGITGGAEIEVALKQILEDQVKVTVKSTLSTKYQIFDGWNINQTSINDMFEGLLIHTSVAELPSEYLLTDNQGTNNRKSTHSAFDMLKNQVLLSCEYCGGHLSLDKITAGTLSIYADQISFSIIKKKFTIPIKNVVECSISTETQITQNPTLTRILLFGIFALGLQKKTVHKSNYLLIKYYENGMEQILVFRNTNSRSGESEVLKAHNTIIRMKIASKE